MTEERSLRKVIGEGVRRVREAAGARQDDLSRHARVYGLAWSRAKIGALENGEKAISIEELALLPVVLSDLLGRRVLIKELIDPKAKISLTPAISTEGRGLLGMLAGSEGPIPIRMRDRPTVHVFQSEDGAVVLINLASSEAEARVARRLGVPPMVVTELALRLWGCSLNEQRDQIVAQRSDAGDDLDRLRALRGGVTRALTEELAQELRQRSTAGDGEGEPAAERGGSEENGSDG
ncbi:helix-turn-helix transcriptional regulator [Candidatus Frankia nodulisporulans]|uniref:helix-turn-helix transcriptional regulator n=1 Tax=Candidatus Frankia nodulisporulans TaxID=2060052 RepID=UPI0013D78B66|nr:helix-turn-helix transcriptional regulator [Candidatus Frankia nodulisporulans]